MDQIWHYTLGEEQLGPVSVEELAELRQSNRITDDTFVWREGLDQWTTFANIAPEIIPAPSLEPSVGSAPTPTLQTPTEEPNPTAASPYAAPQSFVDGEEISQAPVSDTNSPYGPYVDPGRIGQALTIGLFAYLAVTVGAFVSSYLQYQLLTNQQNGLYGEAEYMELATANDNREGLVAVIFLVVFIGCAIVWAMWTNRVVKNAFAFGAIWLRVTPGWAFGWYFVPIMSLFRPFQALSDTWRATEDPVGGESHPAPAILGFWWAAWIISNLISNISAKFATADSIEMLINGTSVSMVEHGVDMALATVALLMTRQLTKNQQERVAL